MAFCVVFYETAALGFLWLTVTDSYFVHIYTTFYETAALCFLYLCVEKSVFALYLKTFCIGFEDRINSVE